jgi:4-hydroxybenzoate polyprenyltransferase
LPIYSKQRSNKVQHIGSSGKRGMGARDLVLHLRLHWQIMLMPLFFWGFLLSQGDVASHLSSVRFWLILFIFHVCFYGGATALNSYYDQDVGPVGGLWNPPPATHALFLFAVGIQILGLVLTLALSRPLFGLAAVMGTVGTAYSHPRTRLKARPWASLLTVSIFQGMGGTTAGWLVGQSDWTTLFSAKAGLTLLAASLVITGFYPLTQLYQREQDRKQGVISFAVYAGAWCFPLAMGCLLSAAGLMAWLAWQNLGHAPAVLAAAGLAGLAAFVAVWWWHFDDRQVRQNYLWMMRLGYLMTGGFLAFIAWQLAAALQTT